MWNGAFSNCFILPKATLAWQKNGQVYSSLWGKLINKPQQTSCPADMHRKMMIFSKLMAWLRVWKLGDTHLLTKIHRSHCCIVQQAYQYLNKIMQGYIRPPPMPRSEEHTSELQSHSDLVCRLLLEKKKKPTTRTLFNPSLSPTHSTPHTYYNAMK